MILGRLSITLNCNIASADEDIFSYGVSYTPLSIGARAHVGNVDFVSNPIAKAYPNKREKAIYGRVLARNVVVHQFAKFYRVDFATKDAMQVAYGKRGLLVPGLF